MMVRKGFALVEVVIGLFLGSLLMGILFQSLSQANKVFAKVTSVSSLERKMVLLQQQFDTDFSGIFLPPDPSPPSPNHEDKKLPPDKITEEDALLKKEKESKEKTKESTKKIKGFTLEMNEKGGVEIISFVTSNPLLVYQQGSPRAVRITYRIIPDTENEGHFLIVRQQSIELSLEKFQQASRAATRKEDQQPIRSYELIRNIATFSCTPFFELFKSHEKNKSSESTEKPSANSDTTQKNYAEKKADNKEDNNKKQKERIIMSLPEWIALSDEEKKKYETPEVPIYVKIQISGIDETKKTHSFEFWFVAAGGFGRFDRKGATELPSENILRGRSAAQKENKRIHLNNGVPEP